MEGDAAQAHEREHPTREAEAKAVPMLAGDEEEVDADGEGGDGGERVEELGDVRADLVVSLAPARRGRGRVGGAVSAAGKTVGV